MIATRFKSLYALSAGLIILISSNFVNAGNLIFNLVFSRWMGPELFSDLAFILTIKLSILGVLNALQMFVTKEIASKKEKQQAGLIQSYRKLIKLSSIAIFILLPIIAFILWHWHFSELLALSSNRLIYIFLLGIPFYLPLAIWRGVAQGKIDLWRIVLSANAEMLIRLFGGVLLWQLGFGVEGVTLALIASLFGAWYFARPEMNKVKKDIPPHKISPAQIWPWAALQLAIVLGLDGDILIGKIYLEADQAGFIAALSLVQRIIFFASFALASILLPQVIQEIRQGKNGIAKLALAISATLMTSIPVVIISIFQPSLFAKILFGNEFIAIAPFLLSISLSAMIATISYLIVTFLMAHGKYFMATLYLMLVLTQLLALLLGAKYLGAGIALFTILKLISQLMIFMVFAIFIFTGAIFRLKLSQSP